jgi:hypothetical protein
MAKKNDPKILTFEAAVKVLGIRDRIFLTNYLDQSNPTTFLSQTESARATPGIDSPTENALRQAGHQAFKKCKKAIAIWLKDEGLSDSSMKIKLLQLVESQKTVFQKLRGKIDPDALPANSRIVVESRAERVTESEKSTTTSDEGETLIAIDVVDTELQRRCVDMGFKALGSYAPKEIKITNLDQLAERLNRAHARVDSLGDKEQDASPTD